MARFQDTGKGSFFGEFAYRPLLQRYREHFLVAVQHLFDWEAKSEQMLALYAGRGCRGRPPYDPVVVFKMLFLSYLYNVSERAIEQMADLNLLMKWFLGLAVHEAPPDHSTLTVFKTRFLKGSNWKVLQAIFDDMIREARAQGLCFGPLQVLDSVHTQADVNNAKDRERHDQGGKPRDPEARVVHKGKRRVVQPDGQTSTQDIRYRGYKTHVSVNADTGIVTSVIPAQGDSADNEAFAELRAHDRSLDLPTQAYGGDKAYDDTDIHERLAAEGLDTAITLKRQRTTKKDANKEHWLQLQADATYQERVRQRFRVEQPLGMAKSAHGFERCRYLGLARYRIQALMTFLVVNAKRMVKLLVGITFRPQAKGRRAEAVTPVLAALPWAKCA